MTTYTITCPPTAAGETINNTTSATGSQSGAIAIDSSFEFYQTEETAVLQRLTDHSGNSFHLETLFSSGSAVFPEDFGGGNAYFWTTTGSAITVVQITQLWDGGRTYISNRTLAGSGLPASDWGQTNVIEDTTSVWTSFVATSSQTTTTQAQTVYTTTSSDTTNVTTLSGTTVQTGTMTAAVPRTTTTQTQGFTTRTANLSTTHIATTTREDTFAKWRTGAGGETHAATFQSATVVCLETSNLEDLRPEAAWIVTARPAFTATSTAAVQQQGTTQFTVFPSFVTTSGRVEQATYDTDAETFTVSTSSEVIETPATYKTTTQTANTITVASQFTSLPSPLSQQVGTTISTQNWFSTIIESRFTGGDISTTTIFSTTTHQGRIGEVTWNATHRKSTTARISFEFSTSGTFTDSSELSGSNGVSGTSETTQVIFNRPISVLGSVLSTTAAQNQCGSSLSWAVAAASNLTSAAQEIGAEGISVKFPLLVDVARTARAPLGSWSYVTAGTTISASAGPASLSVTSAFGPASAIATESTEGAWTLAGAAVSRANLPIGQRINVGGVAATGTATAFYDAGIFSTSDANGSGTVQVSQARTEIINPAADRTAYLPATGIFINGGQRYSTTARNITEIIAESAIITDRAQLIL